VQNALSEVDRAKYQMPPATDAEHFTWMRLENTATLEDRW
jgi:hypothetical protein